MSLTLYALACTPLMAVIVLAWLSHRPIPIGGSAPAGPPSPVADVVSREEPDSIDAVQVRPEREPEPALR